MSAKQQPVKVTITSMTILKIIAVLVVLLFLYAIRDIIIIIVISLVLAAALDPWVDSLQKRGLQRWLGALLIYVVLVGVFGLAIVLMIPPIVDQIGGLVHNFPSVIDQFTSSLNSIQGFSLNTTLQEGFDAAFGQFQAGNTASRLLGAVGNFFGGLFGVVAILVMTFYMVIRDDNIEKLVKLVSPVKYHEYLITMLKTISLKLGVWLRSQLLIGLIVGALVYIAMKILGVEYALVLGLIAAITELIPFIGPWIGAVPGVLIAFTQAPIIGIAAVVVYLVVQQLENHFITPKIMSKTVGLSPLFVIVALLIGAKLAGILGALLAVPVALIISEVIKGLDKIPE